MRWLVLSILGSLLVVPAGAVTIFEAILEGAQEVPPVATGASGMAAFQLNDSMTELAYQIQINGLDLGGQTVDLNDNVTGIHIHNAPAGANSSVVFGIIGPNHDTDDLVVNASTGMVSGVWDGGDPGFQTLASQLGNLSSAGLYVNVHTFANPAGEIRGQILAGVPEPTAALVFAAGFAVLGLGHRRLGAR